MHSIVLTRLQQQSFQTFSIIMSKKISKKIIVSDQDIAIISQKGLTFCIRENAWQANKDNWRSDQGN